MLTLRPRGCVPSRRTLLAAIAGGPATAAVALSSGRGRSRGRREERAVTVEVSVFAVGRLQKPPPRGNGGGLYRQRLAKRALEWALPTLSDDTLDVRSAVRVVETPVPDAVVGDGTSVLDSFDEYLRTDAPPDAVAADSNLLLAHAPGSGAAGLAQIPDEETDGAAAAVVCDGLALGQVGPTAPTRYRRGPYASALSTVVHEVGHTLGLDHDVGDAWRDPADPSRVFVTPMLAGYLHKGPFAENRYGQSVPDPRATANLVYVPHFNRRIPASALVVD